MRGILKRDWSPRRRPGSIGNPLLVVALLLVGCGFLLPRLSAETIYLKNGRKIVAQIIREEPDRIFVSRGGGEYSIPRSIVDRIDKTSVPVNSPAEKVISGEDRTRDLPLPPAPTDEEQTDSSAVKNDTIDRVYLAELDDEASRRPSAESLHRLAQGYQQAAIFLTRQGNPEGALDLYRHALKISPDNLALTLAMAYLLVKQTYYNEAISLLLPVADRNAKVAAIPMLLGSAYYAQDDLNRAVAEWKKSLELQDDPRLREALEKAEKEQRVAGAYMEFRSEHFLVRYEGRETEGLVRDLVNTLEAAFRDLSLELDYNPHETIIVLLYPDQAFRDITRSASWVGALNDGKIRVPVSGLSSMTPELARVLRHELTHSFVRQITVGRCPTWFNEGLAQLMEGATTTSLGSQLAKAFVANKLPSFRALEPSFMSLPADQVGLAYAKSLAALEFRRDRYGMAEIRHLLTRIPSDPDMDSLFQNEIHLSYESFEHEVANYIVTRYGT